MNIYDNLETLKMKLPNPAVPGGVYSPVRQITPGLYYVSGCGPSLNGAPVKTGKLGKEITLFEGQEAARACALNILANIHKALGNLNRVTGIVKILGFVSSEPTFDQQPQVINGASELLCNVFGSEIGLAARSAIGTNVLPGDIPVEIELMFTAHKE